MKSINYLVIIKDDQLAGQVDIWIERNEFARFVEKLLNAENSEIENISLSAISAEELKVIFINQRIGGYEIAYSIKKMRYLQNRLIETTLKGFFEYDIEFLNQSKEKLKDIHKLLS
ncbi:hypothetical protein J40TS1_37830 [Paenibacillus montaniterrae]|uniref:Uncharacterized protein n=1 Tax=Paenibacillus montaniterrae TaxID=429341 RepID=A0A920CYR9_9BACL|nr:hypothetical protein [Paenibacillus montaniterrae]GIP18141.1 hypothetical protein J40TS1_37830 [Paenibacillus montaniterrae]